MMLTNLPSRTALWPQDIPRGGRGRTNPVRVQEKRREEKGRAGEAMRVVVTGGSSGVGAALTRMLVNKGHSVFIIGKKPHAKGRMHKGRGGSVSASVRVRV